MQSHAACWEPGRDELSSTTYVPGPTPSTAGGVNKNNMPIGTNWSPKNVQVDTHRRDFIHDTRKGTRNPTQPNPTQPNPTRPSALQSAATVCLIPYLLG
jgi:hypothetical protein